MAQVEVVRDADERAIAEFDALVNMGVATLDRTYAQNGRIHQAPHDAASRGRRFANALGSLAEKLGSRPDEG